jgi:hypothetical protein
MSAAAVAEKPFNGALGMRRSAHRSPGGVTLGQEVSRDTRRQAAAILEVLAGVRTPTEAAEALGMSLPRYYQVESRALRGLVAACAPRPKGRQQSVESAVAAQKREIERWRREAGRQQALARAAQRAVGLAPPAPTVGTKTMGKRMRRRRVARALAVAATLRHEDAATVPSAEDEKKTVR